MIGRKIVEYKILNSDGFHSLGRFIDHYISKGFEPYGELKIFKNDDDETEFLQAMVKYEYRIVLPNDEEIIKGV